MAQEKSNRRVTKTAPSKNTEIQKIKYSKEDEPNFYVCPTCKGHYTKLDGKTLKIWSSHIEDEKQTGEAGKVLRADKTGMYVQTGCGVLCIEELQLEGKKRMTVDAFLRGYTMKQETLGL